MEAPCVGNGMARVRAARRKGWSTILSFVALVSLEMVKVERLRSI